MQGLPPNSAATPTEVGHRPGAGEATARDPFKGLRQLVRFLAREAAAEWHAANATVAADDHTSDEVFSDE